jgi:site-specific recombinase XerD
MTSLVTYRPSRPTSDLDAAFADFLRLDVASGDASDDTLRNYRSEVESWVAWCIEQNLDPAAVTDMHVKGYRQALIQANYSPITIRWKLSIVRRFYEAARNAGLRPDNPAAGVKPPRVRQATEDFKYLCDEELAKLFAAIPDPEQARGPEKVRRLPTRSPASGRSRPASSAAAARENEVTSTLFGPWRSTARRI